MAFPRGWRAEGGEGGQEGGKKRQRGGRNREGRRREERQVHVKRSLKHSAPEQASFSYASLGGEKRRQMPGAHLGMRECRQSGPPKNPSIIPMSFTSAAANAAAAAATASRPTLGKWG